MKVLKFGGTSVGSPQRIREVAQLINNHEPKIVVLSAMSGTTNGLVEIANYLFQKNHEDAFESIVGLEKKYEEVVEELFNDATFKQQGKDLIKLHFSTMKGFCNDVFTQREEKTILAEGELISTALMNFYMNEQGVDAVLLPALDFMRTNEDGEPDMNYIKQSLNTILAHYPSTKLFITQGFICRNAFGEVDNLQRGGSDYSASLIGAAVQADEIEIWTDIDGMHNNDPRFVENTKPVRQLSFDEAAELAYFGAKILHPTCVLPAKVAGIPVRLLNTMEPTASGTTISANWEQEKIKAVAAKDGITAIKIKSGRMLQAHGFLRKVFEIFESYKTSIDMITTSEVGVSLTIDNAKHLHEITGELQKYGMVNIDHNQTIVCIVGDFRPQNAGYPAQILQALNQVPIRMISYGGSNFNMSLLIDSKDKKEVLQTISTQLFSSHQ